MNLNSENPGALDRLATPRYPVVARGADGSQSLVWAASSTLSWGKLLPTTGREYQSALAAYDELTGVLRVRYRSDLLPTWRVLLGGVLHDIAAILEVGRRSYLDLLLVSTPGQEALTASHQAFEVDLAEGDTSAVITFPTAFDSSPTAIYVSLVIPADGFVFYFAITEASRTATGFTVELSATVPAAGYKLSVQSSL